VTNIAAPEWAGDDWAIAVPLSEMAGSSNLVAGTVYHWRVCAADTYRATSPWSASSFQFGVAPPRPATISGLRPTGSGDMALEWQGASGLLYVEYSLTLSPPDWHTIAGPLQGTNWIFTPIPGATSGYYRVRSE
jgi:hypothetical protein